MKMLNRKSDPKTVGGKSLRVTNQKRTLQSKDPSVIIIDRSNPGRGFRHLVTRRELVRFLSLLPDWDQLAIGLDTIVLAKGSTIKDGWHRRGIVGICAWQHEMWRTVSRNYYEAHLDLLHRMDVPVKIEKTGVVLCFSPTQAKAFQLLHVLLHELGHHHDRMSTRYKSCASRGEIYAEQYANEYASRIWDQYVCEIGI
jgi:hypothetical protein